MIVALEPEQIGLAVTVEVAQVQPRIGPPTVALMRLYEIRETSVGAVGQLVERTPVSLQPQQVGLAIPVESPR